jgi:tol-pal system protein YbgF
MISRIAAGTIVVLFLLGCAHQEDVIVLDQRLAKMERLGKALDAKTRDIEKKLANLNQRGRESGEAIEQQSAVLEKKIDEIKTDGQKETQKLRSEYASIKSQMAGLQDDIQAVRGNLEETEYLLKERIDASEDLGRKIQVRLDEIGISLNQIDARVKYVEQYLNLEPEQEREKKPGEKVAEEKELSDKEIYTASKQAFDQGDFETARAGFEKIIKDFPKSDHADNAQFWVGEIYYREKWYEKAILEYQKVIENYPKGNKVPASLLKQGFAFLSLGDRANARLILKELAKKYPDTSEGKIAVQKLKEIP